MNTGCSSCCACSVHQIPQGRHLSNVIHGKGAEIPDTFSLVSLLMLLVAQPMQLEVTVNLFQLFFAVSALKFTWILFLSHSTPFRFLVSSSWPLIFTTMQFCLINLVSLRLHLPDGFWGRVCFIGLDHGVFLIQTIFPLETSCLLGEQGGWSVSTAGEAFTGASQLLKWSKQVSSGFLLLPQNLCLHHNRTSGVQKMKALSNGPVQSWGLCRVRQQCSSPAPEVHPLPLGKAELLTGAAWAVLEPGRRRAKCWRGFYPSYWRSRQQEQARFVSGNYSVILKTKQNKKQDLLIYLKGFQRSWRSRALPPCLPLGCRVGHPLLPSWIISTELGGKLSIWNEAVPVWDAGFTVRGLAYYVTKLVSSF